MISGFLENLLESGNLFCSATATKKTALGINQLWFNSFRGILAYTPPGSRACVSTCGARFETLLQGPTQWYIEIFEGANQVVMIEIGGVTKARPEMVTQRPLKQRLQWTAPLKSINRILQLSLIPPLWPGTSLIRVTSVAPAERRDIECCASGYPALKCLQ